MRAGWSCSKSGGEKSPWSITLQDQEVCSVHSPPLTQPELEARVQLPVRAKKNQNNPADPNPFSASFHQQTPKGNLAHSFQAVKPITFPRSPEKAHVSWLSCSKELRNGAVSAWRNVYCIWAEILIDSDAIFFPDLYQAIWICFCEMLV